MKAPQENTQESQQETIQHIQQESSSGGEATIADNRPAIAIQRKLQSAMGGTDGINNPIQRKKNNTGLPDNLKSGIENLSGYSMEDVKVHYNSSKPAQLQAHAYAQGTDIHLAPGQEKHLPHEAWHVVQQKQGRVKPTRQLKSKVYINDDAGLEKEADVMGALAVNKPLHDRKKSLVERGVCNSSIQRVDYGSETAGIEIENPVSNVRIQSLNQCPVIFGEIIDDTLGNRLVEITRDMGNNNIYTIELKTTPVALTDFSGVDSRKDALRFAKDAIIAAIDFPTPGVFPNSEPLQDYTLGNLRLRNLGADRYKFVRTQRNRRASPQITRGMDLAGFNADITNLNSFIMTAAWMGTFANYRNYIQNQNDPSITNNGETIFGIFASLIDFYLSRIDMSNRYPRGRYVQGNPKGQSGVNNGQLVYRPDMSDPRQKNAWSPLPKTRPLDMLDSLVVNNNRTERQAVLACLRNMPTAQFNLDPVAYTTIFGEFVTGQDIAGHRVPAFTINRNF